MGDITFRNYKNEDVEKISIFLGSIDFSKRNSCEKVMWDCFTKHPCSEMFQPENIGIWEVDNTIVAIVRLESPWPGSVIITASHTHLSSKLLEEILSYAENTFAGKGEGNTRYLEVLIREEDNLQDTLEKLGYKRGRRGRMYCLSTAQLSEKTNFPEGYELKTLKEIYDFNKLSKLIWRGFNYEGDPPGIDDDVYLPKKHAWLPYQQDICTVAIGPDGNYASFCGMWLDKETKTAFIEPLVTDKSYRGLGLARACVYHSIHLCKDIGAKQVYVEADTQAIPWYEKIGFRESCHSYAWVKKL
ncbi:MAG: GNAT family N-acetyltransferase [Bacillus sp. (in: Bacteria)]|nr:GNAT family N-acetyltransferase [Bacillus sp. (in: firmicutes)]